MPHKNKTFVFSVDDFGFMLPGLDDLIRLKKIYPNFKVTCFTIPMPKEFFHPGNVKYLKTSKLKKWAKMINSYNWMEIAIHGFAHTKWEMDDSYANCEVLLDAVENLFKEIGLKYKKIFKAPYWQYSYDALVLLKNRGYIVALDRNHPKTVPDGLETYYYNWSVEEPLPKEEIIKGHGHTLSRGVANGLDKCYDNIIKNIPVDAEFRFVSEIVEQEYK